MQNYKQHVSKLSSTMYEKDNTSQQSGFYLRMLGLKMNIMKMNIILHNN